MKVADLFIDVGLTGGSDTAQGLKRVEGGLADVKSMSLEAKAAILAALYALDKFTSESIASGVALGQLSTTTGISIKFLQDWDYWALRSHSSAEAMHSTVAHLSNALAQLKLNGSAIPYFNIFREFENVNEYMSVEEILPKIRHFLRNFKGNPAIRDAIAQGLLGGDMGIRAAFESSPFNVVPAGAAHSYSGKELKQFGTIDTQIKEMKDKWIHAFGHLTAEHGGGIVSDLTMISDAVLKLVGALDSLANSLKIFKILHAFALWEQIFLGAEAQAVTKGGKKISHGITGAWDWLKNELANEGAQLNAPSVNNYNGGDTTINVSAPNGVTDPSEWARLIGKELDKRNNIPFRAIPQSQRN